jgi:hypothetical protein
VVRSPNRTCILHAPIYIASYYVHHCMSIRSCDMSLITCHTLSSLLSVDALPSAAGGGARKSDGVIPIHITLHHIVMTMMNDMS